MLIISRMNNRILLAIFFLAIFCHFSAWSKQTYLAILDSPIDYHHPEIQAAIAQEALQNSYFIDEYGNKKSWYQLNLETKLDFERQIETKYYTEQVEFIDAIHMLIGRKLTIENSKSILAKIHQGKIKSIIFPNFRLGLSNICAYLHGTHVAGIAINSLPDIQFINFPLITLPCQSKFADIFDYNPNHHQMKLRHYFEQISYILKHHNIKVVNLSISTSELITQRLIYKSSHFLHRVFFKKRLLEIAMHNTKIATEELHLFIRSNPQAVFVLAAGNDKSDLNTIDLHSAKIISDNLIKVGALDSDGNLATFSNHSSSSINIAALGTGIASARVGGGKIHISGTSQAAPFVSNALLKIFEAAPNLTPQQAINQLYHTRSTTNPNLKNAIAEGRVLIDSSEINSNGQNQKKINNLASLATAYTVPCEKAISF